MVCGQNNWLVSLQQFLSFTLNRPEQWSWPAFLSTDSSWMERTGKAVLVLLSGRHMRVSFLKNICQSFTPVSMFNSYAENVLHQQLRVCEKAYREFIGWSWGFYGSKLPLEKRAINLDWSSFCKCQPVHRSRGASWKPGEASKPLCTVMTKTWQAAGTRRILDVPNGH